MTGISNVQEVLITLFYHLPQKKTKQIKASDEEIYIKEFDTVKQDLDQLQSETSISSLNQTRSKYYNTIHYPKFALEVIKYGISDKAAAAVANALLQDIGYLHLNDVIDPSKMKREKERVCFNASFEQSKVSNIKAIGLDSKRNKNSLVYEQRDIDSEIKLCKSTSTVDHLTFTIESGPICHARWLTTAVRILALYTRTINPSGELKIFVEYIQTVYTPMWFNTKKSKSFTEGSKLVFRFIQRILRLDTEVQNITLPVIYRNSFCLQRENFIAALLYSEEQVYRTIAVVKILETRKTLIKDPKNGLKDGIRVNAIPVIDCRCKNWSKLVNLYDIDCFEPPCLEDISNEELLNKIHLLNKMSTKSKGA
nr:uncharacterized protein LOC105843194 [Hydra vulgaris]